MALVWRQLVQVHEVGACVIEQILSIAQIVKLAELIIFA